MSAFGPGPERATAVYRLAQFIARTAWKVYGRLEVNGLENIPRTGPFLLIANHQSVLDPILIQAAIPRPIFAMAKSTQFSAPVVGPLMPWLLSFPVRRFQTDPASVRTALRLIKYGRGVAVYIEGERSWNGRLQELREGTVRLTLRAGVPVIPTVITGSYDAWPRWDRRVRPATVRIRILEPIRLPQLRGRANREAVPDTAAHLTQILQTELGRVTRS